MEIIGKIISVLPERSGVSSRNGSEWRLASYVLETPAERYAPRHMQFEVFGSDRIDQFKIQAGETVRVSFDIDAHEYQGRWYNTIRAWNVDRNFDASQPAGAPMPDMTPFGAPTDAPQSAPTPTQAPVVDNTATDLPF